MSEPSAYLTSGRDAPVHGVRSGYAVSELSALTSGRDAPAHDVRSGVCGILVLVGLPPVIFATAAVCVLRVSRMRSTGVQGVLRAMLRCLPGSYLINQTPVDRWYVHYAHVRAYCSLLTNEFSTEGLRAYGPRFGGK